MVAKASIESRNSPVENHSFENINDLNSDIYDMSWEMPTKPTTDEEPVKESKDGITKRERDLITKCIRLIQGRIPSKVGDVM